MYIDRKRWREIQAEFGQDEEPLGSPRVSLAEGAVSVEFGNGEGEVSIWVTQKSARVDLGSLSLYADRERKLLLRTVGPYPIQQWEVLYDSNDEPSGCTWGDEPGWHAGQDVMSAASTAKTDPSLELVQQLLVALRAGLGLYYRGTVTETDPAVPLVVDILRAVIADWKTSGIQVTLPERAIQIVRAVRSMVPTR